MSDAGEEEGVEMVQEGSHTSQKKQPLCWLHPYNEVCLIG